MHDGLIIIGLLLINKQLKVLKNIVVSTIYTDV